MLPKTLPELDRIRSSCQSLAARRATVAAGLAMVPVPGIDLLVDASVLGNVIPRINKRFGLTPRQIEELDAQKRSTIAEMIKVVGADFVGRSITRNLIMTVLKRAGKRAVSNRLLRYAPIVGRAASAALSYAAMMYVSNAHIDACYHIARAAMEEKRQ